MRHTFTLFLFFFSVSRSLLFSQQVFQLTVENGYGSGAYAAGDTVHIWSKEWPVAATFSHWSGDTAFLEMSDEWRTRLIMPAQNVTVAAHTRSLPGGDPNYFTFEQIQGKNLSKPVFYYFPPGGAPKLAVWLFPGTNGTVQNWVWKNLGMRQFCNYLVANDVAVIVMEGDEATLHTDLDGDGVWRYDYKPDSVASADIANVRAVRDTFLQRGLMTWATPQAALGFSAGGAFSVILAGVLQWQAAVTHNNPGPTDVIDLVEYPVLFSMTRRDAHPEVGQTGNQNAFNNWQHLSGKGICSQFFLLEPSPLYPERFKRIPTVSGAESLALGVELSGNGCLNPKGYLACSPFEIESMVVDDPQQWPVLLSQSDTVRDWIKDELEAMWASHAFIPDFMAKDLKFMLDPCQASVAVEPVEATPDLALFPNPTQGPVYLPEGVRQVRVLTVQGTPLLERNLSGTTELDVSALPAGLYLLEAGLESGRQQMARFVKI